MSPDLWLVWIVACVVLFALGLWLGYIAGWTDGRFYAHLPTRKDTINEG